MTLGKLKQWIKDHPEIQDDTALFGRGYENDYDLIEKIEYRKLVHKNRDSDEWCFGEYRIADKSDVNIIKGLTLTAKDYTG